MDWTVYWFMLPVCIVIASVAMFSGISGAALLIPVFLIGFPVLDVPRLTAVEAIGTSLMLETSGFGAGVYRYLRMRLVDGTTARFLILVTLPLGALGAVAARLAPAQALRIGYGVGMLALAYILIQGQLGRRARSAAKTAPATAPAPAVVAASDRSHRPCGAGEDRTITSAAGHRYEYCAHGLGLQRYLSGIGAFLAGLISTGVGEATLPGLVRRSKFPVAVAAATSTMVVAGTVTGAALTHAIQLGVTGGLSAIPWNLLVWAVPGAITGAQIGTRMHGVVSERASRVFFAALFTVIGATFLVAFTFFRAQLV